MGGLFRGSQRALNADDCHITIRGADHFLQEEAGEALAMHALNFMLAFPHP